MAAAVDAGSTKDQVLIADWKPYAKLNVSGRTTDRNAAAAGKSLSDRLAATGLPASRINLIGISMGSLVVDRAAAALKSRGGVNALVALDPAAVRLGKTASGRVRRSLYHLADNSRYAIAFHAGDRLSPIAAARTADDTIRVQLAGNLPDTRRHEAVFELFTTIARRAASAKAGRVSRIFSVNRIAGSSHPDWKKDRYDGVYEAILYTTGRPGSLAPAKLTYFASSGRVQAVQGG